MEQQKDSLCQMLDLNQLYVNRSDIDDVTTAKVTDEEKKLTKNFYQEG